MIFFYKLLFRYGKFFWMVLFFSLLLGIYGALHMGISLFPPMEVPLVNIIGRYPLASAGDMELLITRPIEDELRSVPGVERVSSVSLQGLCRISVQFTKDVSVQNARQIVLSRLSQVRSILPRQATLQLENIGTTLQEVVGYTIVGGGDPAELRKIVQYDIAGRLRGIEGISSVLVLGGEQRAFYITLDPKKLSALGITLTEVEEALKKNHLLSIPGYLERGSREYILRMEGRIESIKDLKKVPLPLGKKTFLLGEVANIRAGYVQKHYTIRGNGYPAVALIVRKQPGASVIEISKRVDLLLGKLQRELLPHSNIQKFYDQSEMVVEAGEEIQRDILIGVFLAILVIYFFLGDLWSTLLIGSAIPLSLMITLSLMHWAGLGLNMITLTALALAVGMVVDDNIIVAENIVRHSARGAKEAALTGTMEIAGADTAGTLTTIGAFLPLLFSTGLVAIFLKPFGFAISVALLLSLFLSLTLIPLFYSSRTSVPPENYPAQKALALLESLLQRLLKIFFARPKLFLALGLLTLSLGFFTLAVLPISVLPPIDEGSLLIEYILPPGTSLQKSNQVGARLEKIALLHRAVETVYRRTGTPQQSYYVEGVNRGELMIKLRNRKRRRETAIEVMADLKREYRKLPGVVYLYHQPTQEKMDESFSGLPALFGVTIYGQNVKKLVEISKKVEVILQSDPSVENTVNNVKISVPTIQIRIQKEKLSLYGLSEEEVSSDLKAYRFGKEILSVIRDRENIPVLLRLKGWQRGDLSALKNLPLPRPGGGFVPLGKVTSIKIVHAPPFIARLNGQRAITVIAEVEGSIPALVQRMKAKFSHLSLPEGYSIGFSGQYKVLLKMAWDLGMILIGAIILIYLIMYFQFSSFLQPLLVLFSIPMAISGGLLGLFLCGQPLDISVGMGMVTLVGVAVNNGIVLLDKSNQLSWTMDRKDALIEAVRVRLRPILMTAITTIFSLLPAGMVTGGGSRIFQPFAITVIGGILMSTLGSLLFLPLLDYCRHITTN